MMTQETLREAVARALCKLHIRTVRRHDTPPDELEAMLPGSVDYAWRDFIPQADAAIATMLERLRNLQNEMADSIAKKHFVSFEVAKLIGRDLATAFQQENSDGR
jgi:hypothetical protein